MPNSIEVRVISLTEPTDALTSLSVMFSNVAAAATVDLREAKADQLLRKGWISLSAWETMRRGHRRWHREFTRPGAVGLVRSVVDILGRRRDDGVWTLICEEDVVPAASLPDAVERLVAAYEQCRFDVAILGGWLPSDVAASCVPGFARLTAENFFGTHAWLVPPQSHAKLHKLLDVPMESQLDAHLSQLAISGQITLVAEHGMRSATQRPHASTIQSDCPLCDGPLHSAEAVTHAPWGWIVLCIVLAIALGVISRRL